MHSAARDATAYTLLLSSFVTLAILSREKCKRTKKSPFYILSTSDVFSTVLIAIILLLNHIEAGVKLNYDWQNGTNGSISNRTWTTKEGKYQLLFSQMRDFNEVDEADSNATLTCDTKDIVMQYGMLFAPLTNALVSLLTFAVQCNLNAACAKRKCVDVIEAPASNAGSEQSEQVDVARRRKGIPEDKRELESRQRNNAKSSIRRIMRASKFRVLKEDDQKPAGFLVTSHWLVPLLVVATLYSAEYSDVNTIRHTEDMECVFESNFPVSDFYVFSDAENDLELIGSDTAVTPLKDDYFINEGSSTKPHPNSTEVDQIISKVQNIVKIVLNYARNSTDNVETVNLLDNSEPQNMTEHTVASNISRTENNTEINNEIQKDSDVLLHDLLKNASEELTTIGSLSNLMQTPVQNNDNAYQEDVQTYLASTEESTAPRTTNIPTVQDTTLISDNQIHANIIKRIQAASVYATMKNHYNYSINRHRDRKQPKQRVNVKGYITEMKPSWIRDYLFFGKKDDHDVKSKSNSLRMTNECLISTKFLKLHLLLLSLMIYFLPILLCCILHVRGQHVCKNALAILKIRADLTSTLLRRSRVNSKEDAKAAAVGEFRSEQFSANDKDTCRQNVVEELDTSQEGEGSSDTTNTKAISKNYRSCIGMQNKHILEVDYVAKTFRIIKISLVLCIILWTPIFLGTFLRVFLCIYTPRWLIDIMFICALSFGIVRNILNISIIKIQELCSNVNLKENRIHPVE